MGKIFKRLLTALPRESVSPKLKTVILERIHAFEVRRARVLLAGLFFGVIVCAAVFLEAVFAAGSALSQSGFWQYLSLIVSDTGMIASFWKELTLSLAASLPVSALLLALASGGGLLWSFASFIKNTRATLSWARA